VDKNIDPKPKKALGQNFLLNEEILQDIVNEADIEKTDTILEIGPGRGSLTELLIREAGRVIAIEKDGELVGLLKDKFSNTKNLEVIEGDIRNFTLKEKPYKLVANIPYYLSNFILRKFLESENKPQKIVLLLQKEVAERICEDPGKMSLVSVMVNFYGKPRLGRIIQKENFEPVPKVDSRVIVVSDIKTPDNINEKLFFRILKVSFAQKRKKLINNLYNGLKIDKSELLKMIKSIGQKETARAQELSLKNWHDLYKKISEITR